ncbi:hypothetical protein P692DRAFT_201870606 [Suillus brevipes Sb2]|nr:hypothetical protein P692DRAFT_201870606 [Suillus brevipes Sb2]
MVKTKNDAVIDSESPGESRPQKKMKLTNPDNSQTLVDADQDKRGQEVNAEGTSMTSDDARSTNPSEREIKSRTEEVSAHVDTIISTVPKRGEGASQATLAVKTVIPHPTTQLIDNSEVEEYDEALKARLKALSEYTNPKAHIYAFGKLLPTATWGPYKPINDRSKILCDPATGEPLTIWVVGHIAKMWFMKQGNPESQASITVMPLSQTLGKQSSLLLTKFSNPVLNEFKSTDHKYDPGDEMAENKGGDRSIRFLFDAVYDTRKAGSLKTYSERPMWKLTDLKPGDLILLEMKMTRYSRKGEDNKWQSRAQYEMLAISLLHMAEMPEDDQGMHHIDGLAI